MAELTTVSTDDYLALSSFLANYPGDTRSSEAWLMRLRHWWDTNPARARDTPRGWLLRDEDAGGSIVGFFGNVPSRFKTRAGEVTAYSVTTWRVKPEYRASSIHLYLAQVEAGEGRVLFNNTANETVEQVLRYLEFDSRPIYSSERAYLIPLRPARVVGAYLSRKAVPRWIGALLAPAVSLAQIPCSLLLRVGDIDRVRLVERADASFDALWQRTRQLYVNTTVRSAAYLNWFCFGNPSARKVLLGYFEHGRLRGSMILGSTSWRGLQVLECLDLWCDDLGDEVPTALIAGAARHAKLSGSDLLVLHDFTARLAALFRRTGFVFTLKDTRRVFFRADASLAASLASPESYLTTLEGDLGV